MIKIHSSLLAVGIFSLCSCASEQPPVDGTISMGGTANDAKPSAAGTASTAGSPSTQAGASNTGGSSGTVGMGGIGQASPAGGTPSNVSGAAGVNAVGGSAGGGGTTGGTAGGPAQNLALSHCYKTGCTAQWKEDPCNAFDGNMATVTGPAKTWDSSQGALAVDLGQTVAIGKVVVYYEPGSSDPNPGYALEVSSDGNTWTLVKDVTNPNLVDTQTDLHASGRYLRVRGKQFFFDPWWLHSVSEIEVWPTTGAL